MTIVVVSNTPNTHKSIRIWRWENKNFSK